MVSKDTMDSKASPASLANMAIKVLPAQLALQAPGALLVLLVLPVKMVALDMQVPLGPLVCVVLRAVKAPRVLPAPPACPVPPAQVAAATTSVMRAISTGLTSLVLRPPSDPRTTKWTLL